MIFNFWNHVFVLQINEKYEKERKMCCLGDKVLPDEASSKILEVGLELACLIETSFNNGG